jgi:glycosyltransferase involved in cell wall biosynthesis
MRIAQIAPLGESVPVDGRKGARARDTHRASRWHAPSKCCKGAAGCYFRERIEPQVDGKQVRLIGEVNDRAKQGFLARAAALLFPIDWPEPFGLVMIEAMACGTRPLLLSGRDPYRKLLTTV